MDEGTYDLLSRGRAAAKAGEAQEARFFLEWVLRMAPESSPDRLEALFWLSEVSSDPAEKRSLLEDILALEPGNSRARLKIALLDRRIRPEQVVDPDRIRMEDSSIQVTISDQDAQRFTCPQCGGRMTFTPDGQSLTCEYCESTRFERRQRWQKADPQDPAQVPGADDFLLSMTTGRAHLRPVATQVATCQGCGAQFLIPPQKISASCPYCASTYVFRHAVERQLTPPGALIPFHVNKAAARGLLIDWLAVNRIDPDRRPEALQGVYLPAWCFQMGGSLRWRGYRRQEGRENDGWWDTERRVLEDGIYPVVTGPVLVAATSRQAGLFSRLLPGYCPEAAVLYDPCYLVDWPAETYQVTAAQASLVARQQTLASVKEQVLARYRADYEDLQVNSAGLTVETVQLILLPAWSGGYRVDGEGYAMMVNGQTGEIQAEEPSQGVGGWLKRLLD